MIYVLEEGEMISMFEVWFCVLIYDFLYICELDVSLLCKEIIIKILEVLVIYVVFILI